MKWKKLDQDNLPKGEVVAGFFEHDGIVRYGLKLVGEVRLYVTEYATNFLCSDGYEGEIF